VRASAARYVIVVKIIGPACVEILEMGDDVGDLGQLVGVDLAAADEIENDLAELGERLGPLVAVGRRRGRAPAQPGPAGPGRRWGRGVAGLLEAGARIFEARAALAGRPLERGGGGVRQGLAEGADLGGRRAEERSEGAAQLGGLEATTTSLPCHASSVYRRRPVRAPARRLCLGVIAMALLTACPPPSEVVTARPLPPVSGGKVRVRVFTEPTPVKRVGKAGRFLFVATDDGMQRWDDKGGVVTMDSDAGLPGDRVVALATDAGRKWMWILTDGGLGRYDAAVEVYADLAQPPAVLGIDYAAIAKDGIASLAPGDAGGVAGAWLGVAKGLFFVSDKGGWVATPIKEPIMGLVHDARGWLWMAAKSGLIARKPSGDVVRIGEAQGCEIVAPRLVLEAPGERVMVIGADARGRERIAIGHAMEWTSYRTMPGVTWDAATRRGESIVLMGGDRIYRIVAARAAGEAVRPLARDGMRLVPLTGPTTSEWVIDPTNLVVPPGATVLGSVDDSLLIGTRDLGTARYRDGEAHPRDWLRRKAMFDDANALSVACVAPNDCWVATGARRAWHWNGERFVAGGPDDVVLAVARDAAGGLYALHRAVGEREVHVSRIEPGDSSAAWKPLEKITLTTPGDNAEISFARFANGGLWVGLRYRDGIEKRAYGIAIIDPDAGKVTYHRTEVASTADVGAASKMLPIPVGVVDADVRGETAWFATNEGIARLEGGTVKLWTEADGLRSELARAVTIAPEGNVIVATGAGAGVWDGKQWTFPAALRFEINDVAATRNGHVWMATERGIAAWDGKKVRRVDTRRGLAENEVLDVQVDQYDRVWARGPGSLTLVSQ